MKLAGQARHGERGYAMAALLVAMSVMAIMMTAAMPVWKHSAQRDKEAELIFRGEQYAHAIGLFQKKYANAYPPNLDVLVEQRFLRKKFKDPITGEDFQPMLAGQGAPGSAQQPGRGGSPPSGRQGGIGTPTSGVGAPAGIAAGATGRGMSPIGTPGAGPVGGVIGVVSKSKEKSIRLYNGRNHYNEWAFVFTPQQQTPGGGVPGSAVPGQIPGRGGQPGQPGQRGGSPFPGGRGGPDGRGGPGRMGPGPGQNPFQTQPVFPPPGRGRSGG